MKNNIISISIVAAILIVLNLVSDQYFIRIDLTEDKQYTLSNATKDILKALEEPVTVKAYFSEELPPNIAKTRKDFEDFLIEYNRLSGGNVVYEFVNPNEKEELGQEAMRAGIQPVMINMREKDQMKQQKAFLGAQLQLGEQTETIPFIQPGMPMEYALSTAIKKMSVTNKPAIGFITGHGEAPLEEMFQVEGNLNVLYNLESYTLTETEEIPDRFKTLALVNPKDSISFSQLAKVDNFLAKGGNLFIAMNRVAGDLSTSQGSVVNTALESWLSSKGLEVAPYFVVDANCGNVSVQQQQGMFRYQTNVSFPYMPIVSTFSDHPVTKGLEAVIMQFASPINYVGDSSKKFIPIAFTSENSGSMRAPQYFDIQKQWTKSDFPLQKQVLAAVLEEKVTDRKTARILLVADGDFPVNGPRERRMQLQGDNVNLMVNSVDWLSDDTGLIELRTKGIQYRPLDEIEDTKRTILKYLNFALPIMLILGYGLFRIQNNRRIRTKRMEANYE